METDYCIELDYWTRCGLDGGNCTDYFDLKEKEYLRLAKYAKEYKEKNDEDIDGYILTEYLEQNMSTTHKRIMRELRKRVKKELQEWGEDIENYDYGFYIADSWAESLVEDDEG